MIYLHKIIPVFLLPIMLLIILLLISLIKNNKKFIYIIIGVLYIISTPLFSNKLFKLVEGNEYRKPIDIIDSADAIIVLSGILKINEVGDSTYIDWGDPDRYFGGIALFRAGKSHKLVFTGGKMPWNNSRKTEGDVLKEYAISNSIPTENIFVTKEVTNTEDESISVKNLIGPNKRIILVTSAFHMYRAKMIFEKQGFNVIAYKVDYKANGDKQLTIMDILPSAGNLGMTETAMREIYGRLFYIIKN